MSRRWSGDGELEPQAPGEANVSAPSPSIEDEEPARLVENEVRGRLQDEGFTDEQILQWVEAYFKDHTEGSAEEVVEWIGRRQRDSA
jgi:hypothetical protein